MIEIELQMINKLLLIYFLFDLQIKICFQHEPFLRIVLVTENNITNTVWPQYILRDNISPFPVHEFYSKAMGIKP